MKKVIEYEFEQYEIEVEANVSRAIKRMPFFQKKKIMASIQCMICDNGLFEKAVTNMLWKDMCGWFSDELKESLNAIVNEKSLKSLKPLETTTLLFDFVIPLAYEHLLCKELRYKIDWIIAECKELWLELPESQRKQFFAWCYDTNYTEVVLNAEDEQLLKHARKEKKVSAGISGVYEYLLDEKESLSPADFAKSFREIYITKTRGVSSELLVSLLEGINRDDLMNDNDKLAFEQLPTLLDIYRGTTPNEDIPRFSWSISRKVAEKFSNGKLFHARIPKEQIIAFFNTSEVEVLAQVKEYDVIIDVITEANE